MGRWCLQGDVLAGDQSHQLAGKHRDAEMPAAEARQRPPAMGTTACLALPPTGMKSSMYLYTDCVTRCFNAPNTLNVCPCLAPSRCLCVWTTVCTVLPNATICMFERAVALAVYVIQICTISPEYIRDLYLTYTQLFKKICSRRSFSKARADMV